MLRQRFIIKTESRPGDVIGVEFDADPLTPKRLRDFASHVRPGEGVEYEVGRIRQKPDEEVGQRVWETRQIETALAQLHQQLVLIDRLHGQTLNPRAAYVNDETPLRVQDLLKERDELLEPPDVRIGVFVVVLLFSD